STALHERRRTEEVRRHQVTAVVHPLQLVEATVLMQRIEWELQSARGRRARFVAQQPLVGAAAWTVACPRCGRPPAALVVCRHEHCACDVCSWRCSVCAEDFCADHGIAQCRVDEQPACVLDADVHCAKHLRRTDRSRRLVCERHRAQCAYEPEAVYASDELAPCVTCGKYACSVHSAECLEDKHPHCFTHLQPLLDTNGAYACEAHRKICHLDRQAFSLAGAA